MRLCGSLQQFEYREPDLTPFARLPNIDAPRSRHSAYPLMVRSDDLLARSLAAVWHPCTQMKHHETLPLVPIVGGEGAWLIDAGDTRRAHLARLISIFRDRTRLQRWRLLPSRTPIQPVLIGNNDETLAVSAALEAAGLWVPAIRPPTVPAGSARLRLSLSAAHREDEVISLADTLCRFERQGA